MNIKAQLNEATLNSYSLSESLHKAIWNYMAPRIREFDNLGYKIYHRAVNLIYGAL